MAVEIDILIQFNSFLFLMLSSWIEKIMIAVCHALLMGRAGHGHWAGPYPRLVFVTICEKDLQHIEQVPNCESCRALAAKL